MTQASIQAMDILRSPDNMQWYVVPLLVIAIYMYIVEVQQKNWSAVVLGLTFWTVEFVWEILNALILHFSEYAPIWTTPSGNSAYVIYVGLNIEIAFFFAVAGLMIIKSLPQDKYLKIMGIPNRIFLPVAFGLTGVFVESLLNQCNLLIWDYSWWCWPNIWLIIVAYCLPFYVLVRLHDALSLKAKKIALCVTSFLAITCHLVFATFLGWA